MNKESFLIYKSFYEPLKGLSDEDMGIIFRAIFEYQIYGKLPEISPILNMAFSFIKDALDRDNLKYVSIVERNRNNGKNGGRPENKPKKPTGLSGNPKNPKNPSEPDNDNDNDNDTDSDNVIDKEKVKDKIKTKGFISPTISDVIQYFTSNGYTEKAAKKAFEFYNVANWHDSKGNKVRNWKQKMQSVWFKDENKDVKLHEKQSPKLSF